MSVLDRIATRAMPQTTTSGRTLPGMGQRPTGNIVDNIPLGRRNARNGVVAGTANITFASPGQPLALHWDGASSVEAYYQSLWVMRCVRTIAETLAALPFMAGKSARNPNTSTLKCPLAYMLGPPPGSPNSRTTARALWAWTVCQYIVTGKVGWETQLDTQNRVIGLWPLVSPCLTPVPSMGGDRWWDSFQYQTPYGIIELQNENVMYGWRPSLRDWRQPESPLESARSAISMQVGIERFMNGLLKNGLTAAHMVISPPFEEPEMRRAWQEQFLTEFTGVDNAGKTIFGEAELSDKDQRIPQVQVQQIGTRPVDAQLLQMWQQAKIDVTVALGVPESLIGNASQRCVDSDTEILTASGWKRHDQLAVGDLALTLDHQSGMAEWQLVEHISRYEVVDQQMLHMTGRGHDSLTNAPHRWPVLLKDPRKPNRRRWAVSESLSEQHQIITGAPVIGLPTEPKYQDDFVELVAWHWTEGHVSYNRPSGNIGRVTITQSEKVNPDLCRRIEGVLYRLFGPPVADLTGTAKDDVVAWRMRPDRNGELSRFVCSLAVTHILEKVAPNRCPTVDFIMSLTRSQLELFIDVSIMADGWRNTNDSKVISQSKDERLEGLALAVVLTGRTPRRWSDSKRFYLAVSDRTVADVPPPSDRPRAKAIREWVPYTGTIWCPSLPNGTWFARRNGRVFYTGNTYANADTEYRNFWTITMSSFIGEMEDLINVHLAPRLGNEVGWFDVSEVVALQSPTIFAPLAADKAVDAGILTPKDVQDLLDIADLVSPAESIETAPLGEEGEGPSTQGYPPSTAPSRSPEWAQLEYRARQIAERRRAINWDKSTDIADKVHGYLARSYPRRTLSWVHDAAWTRKKVPLDSIQMERRPGGARDDVKVASMAKQIRSGIHMDPVVLVNSPADDKLRIADGYHRTLAHRHAGRGTIDAYVATPATAHGDWETEMHGSKKSSRALQLVDFALEDPERRTLLGLELRELAHTGPERPRTVKQIVGGPSTGAAPTKTVTIQVTEPVTPRPHAFKGHNLAMCTECEQPVLSPIHLAGFSDENRGPTYPLAVAP